MFAALFIEASVADGRPFHYVGEEVREEFESLPVDLETQTFSAWRNEQLAGTAYAYHLPLAERREGRYVFGSVHPSFRGTGIGRRLVRHGVGAAERVLRSSRSTAQKVIHADASFSNISSVHVFDREGMRAARYLLTGEVEEWRRV